MNRVHGRCVSVKKIVMSILLSMSMFSVNANNDIFSNTNVDAMSMSMWYLGEIQWYLGQI